VLAQKQRRWWSSQRRFLALALILLMIAVLALGTRATALFASAI
jgi:hypothetical protein